MICRSRALGFAYLAALLALAVFTSVAQGAAGKLDVNSNSGIKTAVLTGEILSGQNHVLTIGSSKVTCSGANLEGTVEGTGSEDFSVTQATVTAKYSECQFVQLGTSAQVKLNGCKYKLQGTAELTAQLQVVGCTAGKAIEVIATGGLCTLTIGEQEPLAHVVFENKNPGSGQEDEAKTKDVVAKATLSGLTYTRDGGVNAGRKPDHFCRLKSGPPRQSLNCGK